MNFPFLGGAFIRSLYNKPRMYLCPYQHNNSAATHTMGCWFEPPQVWKDLVLIDKLFLSDERCHLQQ